MGLNKRWMGPPIGGLFLWGWLLLGGVGAQAQTSAISTSRAQVYRVPTTGEATRFQVPQVRLPNAAAARRINAALVRLLITANLEDTTLAPSASQAVHRAIKEYQANQRVGMFSTGYEVLLNRAGLLSLSLFYEYAGAYTYTITLHVTFEVPTGRRLALADLLTDTLALRRQWHQRINARLRAYRREVMQKAMGDSTDWATICEYTGWNDTAQQMPPNAQPHLSEFALNSEGLVLYTNFGFPHAVLNLSPENDHLFSYTKLAPWLALKSPLRRVE